MEEKAIAIDPKQNNDLNLAIGQSRHEKKWKNRTLSWTDFLDRLNNPTVTQETVVEYHKLSKAKRDQIKDVGGYVGGFLKQGRRKSGYVQTRSLVTLDADSPRGDLWEDVQLLFDNAAAVYSTHSHTPDNPRLRLIVPLSRPVSAEEYQPLARKLAELFGMDNFDDTTYQPERLMYWPSHPREGDYVFEYQDLPWLDPDTLLSRYPDWRDSSYWPESSRGHTIREGQAKKQGDPLEKKGVIGAFCRAYDIHGAIETFLSDVYAPTGKPDRYTYVDGSTAGGLVLYDDKFAYSHHGTDPVGDMLTNAFDLVRIHKFGDRDSAAKEDTHVTKLPSYKAMSEFARDDRKVIEILKDEALHGAQNEFDDYEDEDEASHKQNWLTFDNSGNAQINTFLLAKEVLAEVPVFYDGLEFLRYDETSGIWRTGTEDYLRSYITNKKLVRESKMRTITETIANMKNLSYSDEYFKEGDIDKIVLQNGVYSIKDDHFEPDFDPAIYARTCHPFDFDPDADCPTFDGFIETLVGKENKPFVYQWFGYNFYRAYTLQKMLFVYGKAGTGKSTFVNLLKEMIGVGNYSVVTLKHLMKERFAPAGLYRKNANFDTDAKPEYLADGSLLKMLTGEDTIYADRKNLEPINFYNYAKLTFAMNELPSMRDFSGGLKRRLIILKIDKKLTASVKKQFPLDVIRGEFAGIFNKAMDSLREIHETGFTETKAMQEEVSRWERGNDVLSLFIEDECKVDPEAATPVKEAYNDYVAYCKNSGYKALSRNHFVARMKELGYESKAIRTDEGVLKSWIGIQTGWSDF